jgi:hypothetical protein
MHREANIIRPVTSCGRVPLWRRYFHQPDHGKETFTSAIVAITSVILAAITSVNMHPVHF